jgi:hypothetical protein
VSWRKHSYLLFERSVLLCVIFHFYCTAPKFYISPFVNIMFKNSVINFVKLFWCNIYCAKLGSLSFAIVYYGLIVPVRYTGLSASAKRGEIKLNILWRYGADSRNRNGE